MCLALVALDVHPRYALVIAANRDEFHARAAEPAHWWPEGILAGRDRVAGGTWFGVTREGRWALVTNFREGIPRDPSAPSRGALVSRALLEDTPPLVCAAAIAQEGDRYHGFNLLVGREKLAAYTSNRASGAIGLTCGIHGLSNHLLDTPWPKVRRSKARLKTWLDAKDDSVAPLFELLADRTPAQDAALPITGVSRTWERLLSSPFIASPDYGTRCSTVLTIGHDGAACFVERSFDARGVLAGELAHEFTIETRATLDISAG